MEKLVLTCSSGDGTTLLVSNYFKREECLELFTKDDDGSTFLDLTPDQVRSLIAHLTNCLKEVENG